MSKASVKHVRRRTKISTNISKKKKENKEKIKQHMSIEISNNDLFQSDDYYIDINEMANLNQRLSAPDMQVIQYNENHLHKIENCDFNIFLLEKEVGERNILPAISIYIFQQYNYYQKIDAEMFENFLYEIVNGYYRTNPYHHVSLFITINIRICMLLM